MFSLESPLYDSDEYTQYTISQYKEENHPKLSQICNYRNYSKGPKNECETAVVNEQSVFEPLKFYCIYMNGPKKQQQKIVWALITLSFGFSGSMFVNINISDSSICLWFLRSAL